jgi:hypothetical protein
VLNAFNSWNQLRNGRHPVHETTIVPTTTSHPPGTATNRLAKLRGWAFASITNAQATVDAVHHYYIDLPAGPASYVVTLTLTWHRRDGFSQANDLDLHFINPTTGASVGKSDTFANNVEHIHLPAVPPGTYDIQVLKNGGPGRVTPDELYALAIDASAATLRITTNPQPSAVEVRWPFTPPGLILETASQLGGNPVWSVVTGEPAIVGEEFVKTVASTNAAQFFRLRRP